MAFWDRWFRREESRHEGTQPDASNRELVEQWVQSVNDSLVEIKEELRKIPNETVATLNESHKDRNIGLLRKLDELPDRITAPLMEMMAFSKQEILAELVRISSRYNAHDSHDSGGTQRQAEKPIHEITKGLLGSGFLSYAEIGEKLGITHESAKNLVNRLFKDQDKGRLFSKQETDQGIKVGVSGETQDEVLKKKYRTIPNDSH